MIDRYCRQTLFTGIGKAGQKKLAKSFVVVAGCGALGTIIATTLVRAGVGKVRIIDRDFIEYHNLQRQVIFDEDDIKQGLPKAIAAEHHLRKVNSSVEVEGVVADVNSSNIERYVQGADLILDGMDNFETRFLINDVSLKHKIPWVYGGAVSSSGMTMTIIPDKTPCFRCFYTSPSGGDMVLTCDTAGVIAPVPFVIGSLQCAEAMKILVGANKVNPDLIFIDVWEGEFTRLKISRRPDCPACRGKFEFLEAKFGTKTTSLCGQNAIQVINPEVKDISLAALAERLKPVGQVTCNEFMLRFVVDNREIVLFPDGRAIIKNTNDESLARGLYSKYIGM
jgi:molybdopterin/thiamine biosynthesis adenylyltransferase